MSNEFSILHFYFHYCLSFSGCHHALKQQTWNKNWPALHRRAANRDQYER